MARRPKKKRPSEALSLEEPPPGSQKSPGRFRNAAWRLFPLRGRFLSPDTRYVYERLPKAPATFTASDVAVLCVEADRTLGLDLACNPAEVIDLLTSRSLVVWTSEGFVRRSRPERPPRA